MHLKTFLIVGCIFSACARPPQHVRCVDEVTKSFSEIVRNERALIALGSGGYFTQKSVAGVYADFELERAYTQAEAKELLIGTVQKFIGHVNQSEKLRPFLKKYPISASEVSLSIAFVNSEHKPLSGLAQIHLYEGKIYYSTFDPSKKAYIAFSQEGYP